MLAAAGLLLPALAAAATGFGQGPVLSDYVFGNVAPAPAVESPAEAHAAPDSTPTADPPAPPATTRLSFIQLAPARTLTMVRASEPETLLPELAPVLSDAKPLEPSAEEPWTEGLGATDETEQAAPLEQAPLEFEPLETGPVESEPQEQPTPEPEPAEAAPARAEANDGPVTLRDALGRVEATGTNFQGRPQGAWTRWYHDDTSPLVREILGAGFEGPLRAELVFNAGQPEGPCALFDAQGRVVAQLELWWGLPHGRCVWQRPDGSMVREAHYREGRLHGPQQSGSVAAAPVVWIAGRRLERFQPSSPVGQPSVSGWVLAAEPIAEHSFDWWSGVWQARVVEQPTETLRHGEWEWRYPNGQRQGLGRFEFGREVGHWLVWHPSGGKQTEGDYHNGAPCGLWQRWNDEGQLIARQEFPTTPTQEPGTMVAGRGEAGESARR